MKTSKKLIITAVSCAVLGALAYFAYVFPFYEFEQNDYDTSLDKILSLDYLKTLVPLFIIIALSAVGIITIIWLRKLMLKKDKTYSRFAGRKKAGKAER